MSLVLSEDQQLLKDSAKAFVDQNAPVSAFGFPGLKAGDSWCLCASRWLEAHNEGKAPRVFLRRTHLKTLETVAMEILRSYAVDLS